MGKTPLARAAAVCLACFCVMTGGAGFVSAETGTGTAGDIYSDMDAYLRSCAINARIPSMCVAIVDKEKVLFSQSYGGCESCDTPFFLGSVSKSFTAVCVMRLAEQGKIDLDARISAYLPDAADGDRITVRQLLNHTSGLGEYQTLDNFRIVNEQGVHHYANVNYSLLGEIVEAVSGRSYADYITENLFEPLQLSHTAATPDESGKNGVIAGHTDYWGFQLRRDHQCPVSKNAWITVPAGYISSSANDLGKYLQMYLNGGNGVVSAQSIDTMFYGDTVYVDGDIPYWYGYGWAMVKDPLPEPVLRHAGLIETGTSCIFILPERDIAVAVTTDVNDYFVTNEMMDSLGWGIILMLLGDPPNEISGGAYVSRHVGLDLMMLAPFAAAVMSLCLLPKYARRVGDGKRLPARLLDIAFHFLLTVVLLLLVPVFFATPLWVARAFVPDVFITVMVSSALFFAGGAVRGAILYRHRKKTKRALHTP